MSSTAFAPNDGVKPSPNSSSVLKFFKRKLNSTTPAGAKKQEPEPTGIHDCSFIVAVSEDYNLKFRRTMEDAHVYIYNFSDVPDSGYFAVFDGHAGANASHWCSKNLHNILETTIKRNERRSSSSSKRVFSSTKRKNSVSAASIKSTESYVKRGFFKRAESPKLDKTVAKTNESAPPTDHHHDYHNAAQKTAVPPKQAVSMALNAAFMEADAKMAKDIPVSSGCTAAVAVIRWEAAPTECRPLAEATTDDAKEPTNENIAPLDTVEEADRLKLPEARPVSSVTSMRSQSSFTHSVVGKNRARMLYTANVGDARIVLCRNGKALRLTYDHKGSDPNETARIVNSGGVIYGNRVNGMLAVTRSLGDAYMKSYVTGSPYTTRTQLGSTDEFFIIACDGVWDVCSDQQAVDLIRDELDPKLAADKLVKHAIENFSSDNITCMVVRLDPSVCIQAPTAAE
jgi:protein phosphatase PTC1